VQGTPYLNNVAAKAVFLKEAMSDEYKARQFKVISNAKKLAEGLLGLGFDILTSGTDNHMFLVNVSNLRRGLTGATAQRCLEDCGIVVDKHRLPYDSKEPSVTSGIRLGTPIVTKNGMDSAEMVSIAELIDIALKEVRLKGSGEYELNEPFVKEVQDTVKQMCHRFPMR
jgi:glycine hydroxymethyltransferase